jgi:hypothetical protein
MPSPAYIYRSIAGAQNRCLAGASTVDALNLLQYHGSESLTQLPYIPENCGPLSPDQTASGTDFRIGGFNSISKSDPFNPNGLSNAFLDNVKGELAQQNPVIITMQVSDALDGLQAGQIYRRRTSCGPQDSSCNHAMVVVGYDEQKQAFKLINSWGLDWADRGFGWVGYDTFMTEVIEAFTIRMQRPKPEIFFQATPNNLVEGQSSALVWGVTGADSIGIDGIGPVSGNSIIVTPASTITYTLRAENSTGTSTASIQVTVTPKPKPPSILSFTASPPQIKKGKSTKLSWVVSGAASISIDWGIGAVMGDSVTVSPTSDTEYTMTAENGSGYSHAKVRVDVKSPETPLPPPIPVPAPAPVVLSPSCELNVSPLEIVRGNSVTLSYGARNADSGQIDNGIGRVASSGSMSLSPAASTTYTATFTGPGGSTTCSVAVVVREPPPKIEAKPVIASFKATPATIRRGEQTTLAWSVSGATSVIVDHDTGVVSGNSTVVSPSETTTYVMTAVNKGGVVTAETTVTVRPPAQLMLPDPRCGKVAVRRLFGNAQIVEGFVGDDRDFRLIRASANASSAEIDVKIRPWPQCEALSTMDKALARPEGPKVSIRRFSSEGLRAGDPLVFDIQTPAYPSYLHVAYIQADGSVVNLIQPEGDASQVYAPGTRIVLGDPGTNGRHFFVRPPYGREMLVVLASKTPVFPERLPRIETDRQFLTDLRKTLIAKSDPALPDRDVSASYDTIVTSD